MNVTQILQLPYTIDTTGLSNTAGTNFSVWPWIALIELLFIIFLLLLLIKKGNNPNSDFGGLNKSDLRISDEGSASMGNLVNSIAKSSSLYKELSKKCHPDRFINTPLQETAQELFKDISRNKRNYEKLILLKQKSIEKLNINF